MECTLLRSSASLAVLVAVLLASGDEELATGELLVLVHHTQPSTTFSPPPSAVYISSATVQSCLARFLHLSDVVRGLKSPAGGPCPPRKLCRIRAVPRCAGLSRAVPRCSALSQCRHPSP